MNYMCLCMKCTALKSQLSKVSQRQRSVLCLSKVHLRSHWPTDWSSRLMHVWPRLYTACHIHPLAEATTARDNKFSSSPSKRKFQFHPVPVILTVNSILHKCQQILNPRYQGIYTRWLHESQQYRFCGAVCSTIYYCCTEVELQRWQL